MRKTFLMIAAVLLYSAAADAAEKWVKGYYRDDGTYVQGHWEQGGPPNTDFTPNYPYNPYETRQEHDRRKSSSAYEPFAPKPSSNDDQNNRINPFATTPKCPQTSSSGFGTLPQTTTNPLDPYKKAC